MNTYTCCKGETFKKNSTKIGSTDEVEKIGRESMYTNLRISRSKLTFVFVVVYEILFAFYTDTKERKNVMLLNLVIAVYTMRASSISVYR